MERSSPSAQAGYGFPLSTEQEALRMRVQRDGPEPYRSQSVATLDGAVDSGRLREAIRRVVGRHEILRTSFRRVPGLRQPVQVVSEKADFLWDERRPAGPGAEDGVIDAALRDDARAPIEDERGPLLRVTLLPFSPRRHALVTTLPALCGDVASLTNLWREIAEAYGGDGRAPSSDPIQYADYAAWQGEREAPPGAGVEERAARLSGATASTLPLQARPRNGNRFEPDRVAVEFPEGVVAAVHRLAEEEGVAASRIVQACWGALFSRLGGHGPGVVGIVADGRDAEELRDAMGPFERVEEMPVSDPGTSLRAAVATWRFGGGRGAAPAADPGGEGLALGYRARVAPAPLSSGGVAFALDRSIGWTYPFGLAADVRSSGTFLSAELHYDRGRFDAADAGRLARYFATFVANAAAAPDAPLSRLPLLTPREQEKLVVEFNRPSAGHARAACVHHLFEDQARQTPDSVALVSGDDRWTYRRLNARSNQLASLLRRAGGRRDGCIGLCVERSADTIMAMLAILKAGCAYVPLNPDHPPSRLERQLAGASAALLVTTGALAPRFAGFTGRMVRIDADGPLLEGEPTVDLERVSAPEDLVSVIYTSGSTGEPKGVATPHRALANYVDAILRALGLAPDGPPLEAPSFATVSTIAADLGNTAIFPALLSGGTLHVVPYDVATDGAQLAGYLALHRVDVLKIVPSHFRALAGGAPIAALLPRRFLVFGGEALPVDLAGEAASGGCAVINHYGPTETTVGSLVLPLAGAPRDAWLSTVPIGRPIANTDVYVLDAEGHPAPVGIPGELFIGGAGVARGYYGQPASTASRFVPHPFSRQPGARLYRTGDRARYLPDGTVVFLGRVDDQVKVRGYRVEPGEVAAALRTHAAVRQAVVLGREAADGPTLDAYLVGENGQRASRGDLRAHLEGRLPDYMIPASFTWLDALPLSDTGKVDRAALPAPADGEAPDTPRLAPRTEVERALADVWSRVLRRELSIQDDFFDLGGHSLLATQVVARARAALGVDVSLRDLFDNPTIERLAAAVSARPPRANGAPVEAPARGGDAMPVDRVGQLSDEEVDRMLGEILAREEAPE